MNITFAKTFILLKCIATALIAASRSNKSISAWFVKLVPNWLLTLQLRYERWSSSIKLHDKTDDKKELQFIHLIIHCPLLIRRCWNYSMSLQIVSSAIRDNKRKSCFNFLRILQSIPLCCFILNQMKTILRATRSGSEVQNIFFLYQYLLYNNLRFWYGIHLFVLSLLMGLGSKVSSRIEKNNKIKKPAWFFQR